ncbi:ectoine synthase [Limibacillus sp. MBR-115]|jgi:L-ectoine synthase|uniref:ectoine synthase n=1 Tax=Limibacillus sp. MBR-115 TaxID=3156465 RepID=UPI003392EB0A
MIVRTLKEAEASDRRVTTETWESTRLLLANDKMGFSFHVTTIFAGTETPIWYKNHLEAVYCIEGEGEIETTSDGQIYPIQPGTIYALDKNDKHLLRATSELKLACVFNPPINGREVHDADGAYALGAEPLAENA